MSLRSALLPALSIASALAMVGTAVGSAQATIGAKKRTYAATCDEIPGVNQAVNDRWRVFNPLDSMSDLDLQPDLWACQRSSRPVRTVLPLPYSSSAGNLVGDVVEVSTSSRYNSNGSFVDLANRRGETRYGDDDLGDLLDTGAVVRRPFSLSTPVGPAPISAPITVLDAAGEHVLESSLTWTPPGSETSFRLGSFPSAALPFATGFYYAGPDGSLRRHVPKGAASTATWSRGRLPYKRYRTKVHRTRGVTVSYVGFRELRARAAKGGRPASLTLNTPNPDSLLNDPPGATDLTARLVPGSASEVRLFDALFLGRFVDRPQELRLRTNYYRDRNPFNLDVAVPPSLDLSSLAQGYGQIAYLDGAELVVQTFDQNARTYAERRFPAPAGAHDLAFVPAGTSAPSGWLIYTGADGQPAPFDLRSTLLPGRA